MSSYSPDLQEFAQLWSEEPSAYEQRLFKNLAWRVSWKARFLDYAEMNFAAVLGVAILANIFLRPTTTTFIVGLLSIGAFFWYSKKRHVLRQVALLLKTDDRIDLLSRRIRRTRIELKRATLGFWGVIPGFFLGALFAFSIIHSGDMTGFWHHMLKGVAHWPQGPIMIGLTLLVFEQQFRLMKRLRDELSHLEAIEANYREELRLERVILS